MNDDRPSGASRVNADEVPSRADQRRRWEARDAAVQWATSVVNGAWPTAADTTRHMPALMAELARLRGELNEASAAEQQAEQAALAWRDDAQQARDDASSPYGPRDRW